MIEIQPLSIVITDDGIVIAVIASLVSIIGILIRRAVIDMDKMKEMRETINKKRKEREDAIKSGKHKKAQKLEEDILQLTLEMMKQSLKPSLYTFVPFILVFYYLKNNFGSVGMVAKIFGLQLNWFLWYLLTAMLTSIIINKIFKLS